MGGRGGGVNRTSTSFSYTLSYQLLNSIVKNKYDHQMACKSLYINIFYIKGRRVTQFYSEYKKCIK